MLKSSECGYGDTNILLKERTVVKQGAYEAAKAANINDKQIIF